MSAETETETILPLPAKLILEAEKLKEEDVTAMEKSLPHVVGKDARHGQASSYAQRFAVLALRKLDEIGPIRRIYSQREGHQEDHRVLELENESDLLWDMFWAQVRSENKKLFRVRSADLDLCRGWEIVTRAGHVPPHPHPL